MIPQTSFPEQIKLGEQLRTPASVLRYKAAEMRNYLAIEESRIPALEKELADLKQYLAGRREEIRRLEHAAVVLDATANDPATH